MGKGKQIKKICVKHKNTEKKQTERDEEELKMDFHQAEAANV